MHLPGKRRKILGLRSNLKFIKGNDTDKMLSLCFILNIYTSDCIVYNVLLTYVKMKIK